MINIVGASLANGGCHFPLESWSAYESSQDLYFYLARVWPSFVNCSRAAHNLMYWPVTCLNRNSPFVYVIVDKQAYVVKYLEPYCRLLAMIPMAHDALVMNSTTDIFVLLQNGFIVLGKGVADSQV